MFNTQKRLVAIFPDIYIYAHIHHMYIYYV